MKNILMNVEMTKAILDGRKVQTRRAIVSEEELISYEGNLNSEFFKEEHRAKHLFLTRDGEFSVKPRYQIGETIWVREPARIVKHTVDYEGEWFGTIAEYIADVKQIDLYCDDRVADKDWFLKCKGIPNGCIKEMARIFLKVTNVRVEKVSDISYSDLIKEGFVCDWSLPKHDRENQLYSQFVNYFKKTPLDNYVFVYEFERIENV